MNWRTLVTASLALALVLSAPFWSAASRRAEAAELATGQWQTLPTLTYAKLALRVDKALAAQDPKPKVKTSVSKNKKYKTVTVKVSCKAKKAGIQNAKSKKAKAYASMRMKLYADNMYRSTQNEARVTCDKTVHGVNNYGRDNATDYSLYVGREGTAEIYVRYEGILCRYKNGTFRKANCQGEIYWNQTKRVHVASVKIPEGYRLKLQLVKRRTRCNCSLTGGKAAMDGAL